jgi:hypothetical protein
MGVVVRVYFAVILAGLGICWALYKGVVKKDWKAAREIIGLSLFFGGIWGVIIYLLLK